MSKPKVAVAMSGGVDSSVVAAVLQREGYEVTGVYMKNWSGDDYGIQADCPWEEDMKDVEMVCDKLGIPFRSFNFEAEYRSEVVEYFFSEYEKGRTPNPDVMCNRQIKFGKYLEKAKELDFELIATGHYAQVIKSESGFSLLRGADRNKDQSYFLYNINQNQLAHTLFPIGHLPKPKVRDLAAEFGLPVAEKPDSQGICFIGEINVLKFLQSRLPIKEGEILDIDTGLKVGEHEGAYFYTRGQRKGLKLGGQEQPYFVIKTDVTSNTVFVGHGHEHPGLLASSLTLENLHLVNSKVELADTKLTAAVRYRQEPQSAKLTQDGDGNWMVSFEQPQRAVTPGQSCVLYLDDNCLGGGVIGQVN